MAAGKRKRRGTGEESEHGGDAAPAAAAAAEDTGKGREAAEGKRRKMALPSIIKNKAKRSDVHAKLNCGRKLNDLWKAKACDAANMKPRDLDQEASSGSSCSHRVSLAAQRASTDQGSQDPTSQIPTSSTAVCASSCSSAALELETCQSTRTRGHRGPTKGIAIKNSLEGQRLDVEVWGGTGVGRNGANFVTQLGVVARVHCKLWQSNWLKLPLEIKEAIFRDLQVNFQFERTPQSEREILQHMGEMHRKYRGVLKKRFFSGKSLEEAIEIVPPGVDPGEWRTMCEQWSTEKEQSVADRNKANRSQQTMTHRLGRKSIYQLKDDFRKTRGRDPDRPEIFQLMRCRALPDGSQVWVDNESKQRMDQMKQLIIQSSKHDAGTLTSDQVFIQVMGKDRPGRVRCAGRAETLIRWYGPAKGSFLPSSYQHLLEQNQAQAKKIAEQTEEIRELKISFDEHRQQQQMQMQQMHEMQMQKIQEMQTQMQRQICEMLLSFRSSQALGASQDEGEGDKED